MFGDQLHNLAAPGGNWGTGGWSQSRLYAYFIAHEIGHALGAYLHDDAGEDTPNLMLTDPSAIWNQITPTYSSYIRLFEPALQLVNTRNVIGVQTVDIQF